MKVSDKDIRQKSQTEISDKSLRRKSQTKVPDRNLRQKFKQFKCVIRDKDNFATKQRMLGVKIFVQN